MIFRVLLFILIIFTSSYSKVLDVSNIEKIDTKDYLFIIKDNNFSYIDILNNKQMKNLYKSHISGVSSPFWTKLKIVNNSNNIKNFTFYNHLAGTNKIDVYLLKENQLFKTYKLGDLREQNLRKSISRYSSFVVNVLPQEEITIISKLDNYNIYDLDWEVIDNELFFNQETKTLFVAGVLGGLLLLFIFYNILNYITYKKVEYLVISSVALFMMLYQYGFHGIWYFLDLNLNLELITAITWNSSTFGAISILIFPIFFFNLRKNHKKLFYLDILFIIGFLIFLFIFIYAQFFNEEFFKFAPILGLLVVLSTFYLWILSIYMLIKKHPGSIYYFIGEGMFLMALLLNTLGLFAVIPYYDFIRYLIPFSYAINLIALMISISIKNKLEQEELRKSKILLLEQSRFSSIGQAIGHVSHQWKDPLAKVGTSITLLETVFNHDISKFENTFKERLPYLKNSIELMKKSIDEFSNFYKTKNKKEEFYPKKSIENVLDIISSKIMLKKVNIELDIDDNLTIKSYEHILSNIFLVLIDNSLDAFLNDLKNKIKISIFKNKDNVVIEYIDNAGGIKVKPIESIFDYFVTTKENSKGSGIGLSVVKMLVESRLDGRIKVFNLDDGVKFIIKIPTK